MRSRSYYQSARKDPSFEIKQVEIKDMKLELDALDESVGCGDFPTPNFYLDRQFCFNTT